MTSAYWMGTQYWAHGKMAYLILFSGWVFGAWVSNMHPAISLALTEQINHGEAKSFDLSRFSYKRVEDNKPLGDTGPTP
ncbi:MAG: hypothetical protein CM15mP62_33970 [Rhodospirillaceae bacterium]|nr:MAG: hypothetical protein CM15mP62_33970 [Rhodospirillaceae bacterium]